MGDRFRHERIQAVSLADRIPAQYQRFVIKTLPGDRAVSLLDEQTKPRSSGFCLRVYSMQINC